MSNVVLSEEELGDRYDQPKHNMESYQDDDEYDEQPYRYLTKWKFTNNKQLPVDTVNLSDWVVEGTLLPASDKDEVVTVQLHPIEYSFDRSKEYRGFWITTKTALYWLHEPAEPMRHVDAQALLAALSNILDNKKKCKTWSKKGYTAVKKENPDLYYFWPLIETAPHGVAMHLIDAIPNFTYSCKFLSSLRKLKSKKHNDIVKYIEETANNSKRTIWGQPLGKIEELMESEDSDKSEDAETLQTSKADTSKTLKRVSPSSSESEEGKKFTKKNSLRGSPAKRANSRRNESDDEIQPATKKTKKDEIDGNDNEHDENDGSSRPRRASRGKRVISYAEKSDEEEDDEFSDNEKGRKRKPAPKKKRVSSPASNKKKKTKKNDSDDESVVLANDTTSESEDLSAVDEESSIASEEEEEVKKPKSKKKTNNKKVSIASGAGKTSKKAANDTGKKKMCDSFTPMNTPSYMRMSLDEIKEQKEFLDPCGMEATDDIIDRLVGDQVDKIGELLKRSLANNGMGSSKFPLQLGTACSGTDAPALALTLVSEQLELRGLGDLFKHTHEFSCEVSAFKQAYLARNFDSILYPDICKLTDDKPRDVYGQVKEIPPFNLFVAGTSCKNFSMLRASKRLDIEDYGCSGETFLAATEFLFKEKPPMAIFENVINAPWLKMQEYITGRVKLSECDSSKSIKVTKDDKKDLIFALDKSKNIVVDQVPQVYGVRCGAVVDGFLRPGENEVNTVKWPSSGSKQTCSLTELMKFNKISKKDDILVFKTECTYCTHFVKVDTKDFGLPQTRQRTYMLVWRPDDDNVHDDLGDYWEKLVGFLKSPVRHSLQSFILQVDHDIIRVFREALRGPQGRQTMREVALEKYFWDGTDSNYRHNKVARDKLGLEDEARFTTNWHKNGRKQIPPHYWLEYLKCNKQRETDLIDILHASGVRDAESHDSNFASFYWNISQNASREKHRTACPGIAGCITPGGDFFLPQEGRPILGCEKLMIQGIPYFRLALGNETEVQLGDLAGNAMSLTVVCATMLAAITCNQLRRETMQSKHQDVNLILQGVSLESRRKLVGWDVNDAGAVAKQRSISMNTSDASKLFLELADLAKEAIKSSIWCTCETSGSDSHSDHFLECQMCRVTCCRNCVSATAGYNLQSHDTKDVILTCDEHNMGSFRSKLLSIAANNTLVFSRAGIEELVSLNGDEDRFRVTGLWNYKFCFHDIKRERKKWSIIYYARKDAINEPVAEFRILVGELKREHVVDGRDVAVGVKGELKSFLPAKTTPLVYGSLAPCATLTFQQGSLQGSWEGHSEHSTVSLIVKGFDSQDSHRVEVGLTDAAANALEENSRKSLNEKHFKAAKTRGETRRWIYAEEWKKWPGTITIGIQDSDNSEIQKICGSYRRANCRQTINQSALWVKEDNDNKLYLLFKPNVNRIGPDSVILSSSIDHNDLSSIVAFFPEFWEPCDALDAKCQSIEIDFVNKAPLKKMVCSIPKSNIAVQMNIDKRSQERSIVVSGFDEDDIKMLCRRSIVDNDIVKLDVSGGQKAPQIIRVFNIMCAAPILQFASTGQLASELQANAPWNLMTPSDPKVPFGCSPLMNPPRPREEWSYDSERKAWQRISEPGASRKYYLALQAAPQPFEFWVNTSSKSLTVKIRPEVVAHHAAHQLIEGRGLQNVDKEVVLCFRLSDMSQQSDPEVHAFRVRNCETERVTTVALNKPYELYDRQKKVVTKMVNIESRKTAYEELEMSEHAMPGATGLSLLAKATRQRYLNGGVICDAIGSGKTVISIAIMLHGLKDSRKIHSDPKRKPYQSSASLVIVPPALIDQWGSELKKFTSNLKVIKIYDNKSFEKFTLRDFVEADVIICPIDILEADGYMSRVMTAAGDTESTVPTLPPYSGQMEQNAAKGVWIPFSSQDPFGGANNNNNQKRRDQSAYFTHVYLTSVRKLRKKEFKSNQHVPLEYFEFERVFVDEIHESLCTTKNEMKEAKDKTEKEGFFKEKNRRAGRELLGITQKDIRDRPLVYRKGIFGLTGTPLLDSSSRVTELANLMGNAYICGLSSHWRKLERESARDIFLHSYLEPKQSREIRRSIYTKCQDYIDVACCRNKAGKEMDGIELVNHVNSVRMTEAEKELYLKSQSGIPPSKQSLAITPEDFDAAAGHNISKFLRQNASLATRGKELVRICREILRRPGDERVKILCFTDGRIGAGLAARDFLRESGLGCTYLEADDSVETKNKKISWYQTGDATEEDRKRPRVLVLHFEHAAGLNLQTECHDLIFFSPLYVGDGGSSSDAVSDTSTELQAIGRIFRANQTNPKVYIWRIDVKGPNGEDCLDSHLIKRNTDEETIAMAINAGDD